MYFYGGRGRAKGEPWDYSSQQSFGARLSYAAILICGQWVACCGLAALGGSGGTRFAQGEPLKGRRCGFFLQRAPGFTADLRWERWLFLLKERITRENLCRDCSQNCKRRYCRRVYAVAPLKKFDTSAEKLQLKWLAADRIRKTKRKTASISLKVILRFAIPLKILVPSFKMSHKASKQL